MPDLIGHLIIEGYKMLDDENNIFTGMTTVRRIINPNKIDLYDQFISDSKEYLSSALHPCLPLPMQYKKQALHALPSNQN